MDDETISHGELAESRGYAPGHRPSRDESMEPDVLLDVPQLRVEEIILDVEDLRAHVSVEADVLNLLRLSVGADVQLGGVHLEIRGVEAQVLLKARLDTVAEIINRVLTSVDRNPDIIDQVVPSVAAVAEGVERAAGHATGELAGGVEEAAPSLGDSVAETDGDTGSRDVVGATERQDSAAAKTGRSRGLRRRRKQGPKTEEPPP